MSWSRIVAQGTALTAYELKEMIGGYYQAMGLDENGFVPIKKLEQLEITSLVSGLESRV
jgi:aldehyde:ferredoxin oxidoreductase